MSQSKKTEIYIWEIEGRKFSLWKEVDPFRGEEIFTWTRNYKDETEGEEFGSEAGALFSILGSLCDSEGAP